MKILKAQIAWSTYIFKKRPTGLEQRTTSLETLRAGQITIFWASFFQVSQFQLHVNQNFPLPPPLLFFLRIFKDSELILSSIFLRILKDSELILSSIFLRISDESELILYF